MLPRKLPRIAGIPVRTGLHAGEVEVLGDDIGPDARLAPVVLRAPA
jgi:hypothetical protein